jgi:phosphoribosylformylglycinamidine synthase
MTQTIAQIHGITEQEYKRICQLLGREPNEVEAGIFGVMWSEHCGYKHSRTTLKLLPREGERLLVKAGEENAGAVDIGHGYAVVFKAESHNHPSAVEPHAGAATGAGGIIRDIFTMGARPIALLDSLRFGKLDNPKVKRLFSGVVKGIADYGNCVGIPTVGGEVYFDESFSENPLVNVMCVGIVKHDRLAKGKATGVGNPVMYVGASTGRDGLGGASFASRELTEESEEDRPAVQVGDPFMEKLLLEACLELLDSGAIIGIQDMGAAGFTCATCETASRGNSGMEVDVALVPRRETGMSAYEIMLSESQERMLVIVKKGREKEAERIFQKWDLHGVVVGHVTDSKMLRVRDHGKLVAEIPAKALTECAPAYTPEAREPRYLRSTQTLNFSKIPDVDPIGRQNPTEVLKKLLSSPTIASKEWVYQQYDHMVRTNTLGIGLPGRGDAAILRVKETGDYLAISTDCNSTYCYLDPFEGAKVAVAESARNIACVGAEPLGLTDCLNFGNPEDPEVFWQFRRAVEGIAEACRVLDIPVTGGNVSFYNESPQGAIDPTPMIGIVGLVQGSGGPLPFPTSYFQREGDLVFLVGETREELGGSEYLKQIHGLKKGLPPRIDLHLEKCLHQFLRETIANGWIRSAHDCSEGGLAVALAECCVMNPEKKLGAEIDLGRSGFQIRPYQKNIRLDALLFGETQSRVIISASKTWEEELTQLAHKFHLPFSKIGIVRGDDLKIGCWIRIDVTEIDHHWRGAIGKGMGS